MPQAGRGRFIFHHACNNSKNNLALTPAGQELYRAEYTFNHVGKRLSIYEKLPLPDGSPSQRQMQYTYDGQYRLEAEDIYETGGAASRRGYTYDTRGNRLSMTRTSGGTQTVTLYTYNEADQLLSETRGGVLTSYQYDSDGNRARKIAPAATAVYNWDGVGRLAAVDTNDDGTPDFLADYDYRTRRIRTQVRDGGGGLTETRFRYDGGVAFDELDAQGNVKSGFTRVSGLGGGVASIVNSSKPAQDGRPARKEHYIYNAVGHSVLLVDGDCTPVQVNLFEAFGGIEQTWGNSDNNRLANTKERDTSTGLDNHGFRYYDASIGRYISNDPIGYEGGFNLYVHCTNDPVNKFDPLGLSGKSFGSTKHWVGLGGLAFFKGITEFFFGGTANYDVCNAPTYTPPKGGVGGFTGGITREVTMRVVPAEENPTQLGRNGMNTGGRLVPCQP